MDSMAQAVSNFGTLILVSRPLSEAPNSLWPGAQALSTLDPTAPKALHILPPQLPPPLEKELPGMLSLERTERCWV